VRRCGEFVCWILVVTGWRCSSGGGLESGVEGKWFLCVELGGGWGCGLRVKVGEGRSYVRPGVWLLGDVGSIGTVGGVDWGEGVRLRVCGGETPGGLMWKIA
jgi:hypothetical protein